VAGFDLNTDEIMGLSLKLASLRDVPADSAVYVKGEGIEKVLFGVDAGVAELLLAKSLGYDAVIAHHPMGGTAILNFSEVFKRHIPQMMERGVPRSEAEKAVSRKLSDLTIDAHSRNYNHAVDVANLLKIPYMNIHTPLDEIGRRVMSQKIEERVNGESKVKDVVETLQELNEFRNAATKIEIRVGKPDNKAGKVIVSHGAGTNGGYEIAKTYFAHGFGTVVYIHVGLSDLEKLRAENSGNLIITGHMASDSVGINPFIHELENRGIAVTMVGVVSDKNP
jgi:putative NIF3 family GTP cyclohydrolase 1 type 2